MRDRQKSTLILPIAFFFLELVNFFSAVVLIGTVLADRLDNNKHTLNAQVNL